jgi:hypothetical protein
MRRRHKNGGRGAPYRDVMRKLIALTLFLLACHGAAKNSGSAFDRAGSAAGNGNFREARELYAAAAAGDADPERREIAAIRLANIEWRVFREHAAARARLQKIGSANAHIELARVAIDLRDYPTARDEAGKALAAATKKRERLRATSIAAEAVVRDDKATPEMLREVIASMRQTIAADGGRLGPSRILARAGIRAGDGAAALEGINGYYHVSPFSGPPAGIAGGHATLARLLPAWKGGANAEIADALSAIRFFDEAAILAPGSDVARYAAALHRVRDLTHQYYRHVALGQENPKELREGVARERDALGIPPQELVRRYGIYANTGKTGNHVDLHLGHVVVDSTLQVEQYGQKASVRFVALDEMTSNGFSEWANDGASGDGGWGTAKEIYQVRPRYADGALRKWAALAGDPEERAEEDRKIREETVRDRQRAKEKSIQYFAGLAKRLERQYLDSVFAANPSRDAFLARVEKDEFTSSILLHEGRHAIDHASGVKYKAWELEYRAKLSEIALAPAVREALASVLDNDIGGDGPHAKANGKLAEGLVAWMEAHREEISGYDASMPPLPQIDRLTDDQIRVAVRGLDPMASGK